MLFTIRTQRQVVAGTQMVGTRCQLAKLARLPDYHQFANRQSASVSVSMSSRRRPLVQVSRSRSSGRGLVGCRCAVGVGVDTPVLQWRLIFDADFLGILPGGDELAWVWWEKAERRHRLLCRWPEEAQKKAETSQVRKQQQTF